MILDELSDGIDPEKLFDKSQYNTLIIDREGFSKKENTTADLIEDLLEPGNTRADNEALFLALKEQKAQKMLVQAIEQANDHRQKQKLAAACWESGLDFSSYFVFFGELILNSPFEVAMEALTVIDEMENKPSQGEITQLLTKIKTMDQGTNPIIGEFEKLLNTFKHND